MHPTSERMLLAARWIDHLASTGVWDEVDSLTTDDPEAAWRLILLMVAYAPDYGVTAGIAAGPVEDLYHRHKAAFHDRFLAEASRNARFRTCLDATYLLLPLDPSDAPEVAPPQGTPDEIRMMVAYFHYLDTSDVSMSVDRLLRHDPEGALELIDILLRLADEKEEARDDIFRQAVTPFIQQHLDAKRGELVALTRKHAALRTWIVAKAHPPIDDVEKWRAFVDEVTA